jgi:hypothetical protein
MSFAPTILVLAISTAAVAAGLGHAPSLQAARTHESPFACDRLTLDPVARTRHFDQLGPELRALTNNVRELAEGYAFKFPADAKAIAAVAEWAAGERLCCPFFNIEIRLEPEGGPVWLTLTGRTGTKAFIEADLASWIRR